MIFGSDNLVGASPQVLDALVRANNGALAGYGADDISRRVERRPAELFEHNVKVFLVTTGIAANALALAAAVPPWGMAICHREAMSTKMSAVLRSFSPMVRSWRDCSVWRASSALPIWRSF